MNCKYCHKPAGFFCLAHKECKEKHSGALSSLPNDLKDLLESGKTYQDLQPLFTVCADESFVSDREQQSILLRVVNQWAMNDKNNYLPVLGFIRTLPEDIKAKVLELSNIKTLWAVALPTRMSAETCQDKIDSNVISAIRSDANEVGLDPSLLDISIGEEFKKRIEDVLEDGIIDDEEEEKMSEFIATTGFDPNTLSSQNDSYHKFIQALILKDLSNGDEPHRVDLSQSSVMLSKGEYPIWLYNDVKAYLEKTGKQYVGGNRGVSFKICKGVYYRTGASKGHAVDYDYTESQGQGSLLITNKAVYYVGPKTVKILIGKIITLEPYSDGIKIQKDAVRNNTYTFVGFDPWFMMNLLPMLN